MAMSRNIVSYFICMVYFLCKLVIILKTNKLIYVSYIEITISVYGIRFICNNSINNIIIRILLDLKLG